MIYGRYNSKTQCIRCCYAIIAYLSRQEDRNKNEDADKRVDVARRASVDIGAHDSVTIPLRSIGLHRGANNGRSTAILE